MAVRLKSKYILGFTALFAFGIFFLGDVGARSFSHPSGTSESQFSKDKIVADLGGMHVEIPHYFAKNVEYDGDPGWGEKKKSPLLENTGLPKLRSFGFDVRFPDMVGLSSPEMYQDKRKTTIFKTMWIRVGINAGENYPGDEFLERRADHLLVVDNTTPPFMIYKKLDQSVYGLSVYTPAGVNPKNNKPYRQHEFAEDVFVFRNEAGIVKAHITCSNTPGQSAPCRHFFKLQAPVRAQVYLSYRRGLLPEWQKIQESVNNLILSFEKN
ncbi:hypothetical protein [Cellvibrio sp. OA-2007]|uniref:hypothetical protein n=1 Tax=Cellvibrio sp. OA-2007 TaxID=529823 RepID=UPI0007867ED6|nr:hypothetical protein [Cellvibrio sp. OA-2007]